MDIPEEKLKQASIYRSQPHQIQKGRTISLKQKRDPPQQPRKKQAAG